MAAVATPTATRRRIVDMRRIVGRLAGMNEHDTMTSLECCNQAWPLSPAEVKDAALDGMPAYALAGIEHVCCLEPDHEGTCACACGSCR